jgi:hypothetical protein
MDYNTLSFCVCRWSLDFVLFQIDPADHLCRPADANINVNTTPSLLEAFEMSITSFDTPDRIGSSRAYCAPLSTFSAYNVVTSVLAQVSKADVHQPCGRTDFNVGELSMIGVTRMLARFGEVSSNDVFVDVGSGVGNVLLQVALESAFDKCIGIEMRPELALLTRSLVHKRKIMSPHLSKISVINVDISKQSVDLLKRLEEATHVFSHNSLFTEAALLALDDVCWLPKLKCIVLSRVICPRHNARCTKAFCRFWTLLCKETVPVTYKSPEVDLYFFVRK